MRRILIDDNKTDIKNCSYNLPWKHDSICFNFMRPEEVITYKEISEIPNPADIETLVIGCVLDDYSFISQMDNLRQLYIYEGEKIDNLEFLENLVNLCQLYIANLRINSLNSLVKLLTKQKQMIGTLPPIQKLLFGLSAICIETDCNELNGKELYEPGIMINEININGRRIRE